ncbi:MAG: alpha-galactosidase [Thermoguttaceae bacterium]|jgi:alpha-galactosidase
MKRTTRLVFLLAILAAHLPTLHAADNPPRMAKEDWVARHLGADPGPLPGSFLYDGKPVGDALATWTRTRTAQPLDKDRTRISLAWTDPRTQLAMRCEAVSYNDYPVVEWVIYLKNTGTGDTPVLSDIRPLDASVLDAADLPCTLHYAKGGVDEPDAYAPREQAIAAGGTFALRSVGGRSSNGVLPFFNLQTPERGVLGAIGWSGNWAAQFSRDNKHLTVAAGMQRTHLKLHPGEEIRTPRMLLLFWEGERIEAQNLWRRFLLAHHTRIPAHMTGRLPVFYGAWGEQMEQTQIDTARWFVDNQVPIDNYWIDAGWYGDKPFQANSTDANSEWWKYVGTWRANKFTYPRGLKPIGDALRAWKLGFTLWLEPERVFRGSDLAQQHPDWLLGPLGDDYLLNLGIPAAREAMTDLVSSLVTGAGVTCFRQDFNTDPERFWQGADAPDRVGIAEIRHIEGLYAFWDALLARHAGLLIDNCASGGRRLDLETISRSVALWRSDYQCRPDFSPAAMQCQTYGSSLWIPLSGGVIKGVESYAFRSGLSAAVILNVREQPQRLKVMTEEARTIQPFFFGDYYPLTPYGLADDAWLAMQFHRRESADGVVLAFRRPKCAEQSLRLKLRGLAASADYAVRNLDQVGETTVAGRTLMTDGLLVTLPARPAAALIRYRKR